MMNVRNITLRMTPEDIEDARKRHAAKHNNKTTVAIPASKRETELDLLQDIRELLLRIEANTSLIPRVEETV